MPCTTWYNGWSPEERQATVPIQLEAFRLGKIKRPTSCSICGFNKPKRPSDIVLHNERYDQPLIGHGLCRRCHQVCHLRFDHPGRWRRLLNRVASPDCWAWRLALDPACQRNEFHDTSPNDK